MWPLHHRQQIQPAEVDPPAYSPDEAVPAASVAHSMLQYGAVTKPGFYEQLRAVRQESDKRQNYVHGATQYVKEHKGTDYPEFMEHIAR